MSWFNYNAAQLTVLSHRLLIELESNDDRKSKQFHFGGYVMLRLFPP